MLTWNVGGALPPNFFAQLQRPALSTPAGQNNRRLHLPGRSCGHCRVPANVGRRQFTVAVITNSITNPGSGGTLLPSGQVGSLYSFTFSSAGGGSWSLNAGSYLPPGLNLVGPVLSGTPTATGQYQFTLTNSAGPSGAIVSTFTLSIYPAGVNPPVDFTIGNQGTFSLDLVTITLSGATGGSGTGYLYSLTPGSTPVPGLRFQNGPPLPTSFGAGINAALMGVGTMPRCITLPFASLMLLTVQLSTARSP